MDSTLKRPALGRIEELIPFAIGILLFVLMTSILSQFTSIFNAGIISLKNILIFAIIAYVNSSWIIPKLYLEKKYGLYSIAIVVLIIISALINLALSHAATAYFDIGFNSNFPRPTVQKGPGFFLVPMLLSALMILLISTVYSMAKTLRRQDHLSIKLQSEKLSHELNFLRSQINPHFIFNALNNIYASTSIAPEKTKTFILRLADMLRYVLSDSNEKKVYLEDEIQYIKNYIFFQKERDRDLKNVKFNIDLNGMEKHLIEPMLFMPLVENAFQHSRTTNGQDQFVHMTIRTSTDSIHFFTKNSIGLKAIKQAKNAGIGLKNVQRRLEILYPNQHQFKVIKSDEDFFSELIIKSGTPE